MTKKDEKGSGLVEIILVVIIIVLLGAVVYFYLQANQKKTIDSPANNSEKTTSVSKTAEPKKESLDSTEIKTTVQAFYDKYSKAIYPDDMKKFVAEYGSKNFVSYYNNLMNGSAPVVLDPTMCVQNTPDSGPTVTNVQLVGPDKATVTVTENFSGSGPLTFTASVIDENGPKINSVTCPAVR